MSGDAVNLRRRRVLAAGGALALAACVGLATALRFDASSAWIEAVIRKHLPGVCLDEASLRAFAVRTAHSPTFTARKVALALQLDRWATSLVRFAPPMNAKLKRFERLVLSDFLASSNFFRISDPRAETVVCGDAVPACSNPFAVFRNE
jgi:hypothetical protein